MKSIRNKIVTMACLLLVTLMSVPMISKAGGDYFSNDYTYTIRIYTGGQGTFADGTTEMVIKAAEGTTIDLSDTLHGIEMKPATDLEGNVIENKYYPKGIRESGKDNNTINTIIGPVFQVTKDMDYVVAYAMQGGDVSYTVRYLKKENEEELSAPDTFYGNVGEKTVVAYKHIPGFVPQAFSLAKTLQEDETLNVLTFYYVPGNKDVYYYTEKDGGVVYYDEGVETFYDYIPGETVYVNGGGGVKVIQAQTPKRKQNVNHNNTQNVEQNEEQNVEQNVDDASEQESDFHETGETTKMDSQPEVLIDLDEPPIPLASGEDNISDPENDRSSTIMIIVVIIAIVVTVLLILLCKKMKKKQNKESDIKEAQEKTNEQIVEMISGEDDEK